MSFGFSVGDFLAVAQLAYQLSKALSDTKGTAKEYRELITELHVVHKVLLQVNDLRAANQLAQATVNALLFTVNTVNVGMEAFLDEHAAYSESLKPEGSGNPVKDIYKKGKWSVQMPEKVKNLQRSLATMLAAINCLVSVACYYNTGFDARCDTSLQANILRPRDQFMVKDCPWEDVNITSRLISYGRLNQSLCPGFEVQTNPAYFFRPGQIFTAQITSHMILQNGRTFRDIDFGNLPLEPIPKLRAMAESEQLEDRAKRLAQIRQLPLDKMTLYCKDTPGDRKTVQCRLCPDRGDGFPFTKDHWASYHFRLSHWDYYFAMMPDVPNNLSIRRRDKVIPWEKQSKELLQLRDLEFSAEKWIVLEDVPLDIPIDTDEKVVKTVEMYSQMHHYLAGPVMIQRFVVVREGSGHCLCLGIHTYSRQGCGNQPDQELYGILSSEKTSPPLQPNETKIVLSPVRMKPDHPSLALSSTARIHYGRAYEISHDLPVQSLGLVHPASMEVLLDQFEAKVTRRQPGQAESFKYAYEDEDAGDLASRINAADMSIVKDMRESIAEVLGPKLAPAEHQPPKGTFAQFHPRPPKANSIPDRLKARQVPRSG